MGDLLGFRWSRRAGWAWGVGRTGCEEGWASEVSRGMWSKVVAVWLGERMLKEEGLIASLESSPAHTVPGTVRHVQLLLWKLLMLDNLEATQDE